MVILNLLINKLGSPEGRKLIFENGIGFTNFKYFVCKQSNT